MDIGCKSSAELDTALELFNPANFDQLLDRASRDPLKVAHQCQTALVSLDSLYEKPLNQLLAIGIAVAA